MPDRQSRARHLGLRHDARQRIVGMMKQKQPRRAKSRERLEQAIDARRQRRCLQHGDRRRRQAETRSDGFRNGCVAVLVRVSDHEVRRAARKRPHEVADECRVAAVFMNLRREVDIRAGMLRIAEPIQHLAVPGDPFPPDAPESPVPLGDAERPRPERRPGVQARHLTLESTDLRCPLRTRIRHRARF
jgi:hypothetical protein